MPSARPGALAPGAAAGWHCVASPAAIPCIRVATTPCLNAPTRLQQDPDMPETTTLIVNARLVNEGREFEGDLRIVNGRIDEIGSGLNVRTGEAVVDAAGRRLLPGMIDDQVHFREPGLEYKADM